MAKIVLGLFCIILLVIFYTNCALSDASVDQLARETVEKVPKLLIKMLPQFYKRNKRNAYPRYYPTNEMYVPRTKFYNANQGDLDKIRDRRNAENEEDDLSVKNNINLDMDLDQSVKSAVKFDEKAVDSLTKTENGENNKEDKDNKDNKKNKEKDAEKSSGEEVSDDENDSYQNVEIRNEKTKDKLIKGTKERVNEELDANNILANGLSNVPESLTREDMKLLIKKMNTLNDNFVKLVSSWDKQSMMGMAKITEKEVHMKDEHKKQEKSEDEKKNEKNVLVDLKQKEN